MTPLILAAVIASTDRGVLVARSGTVAMYNAKTTQRVWGGEGLPTPGRIVTSKGQQAVIIDPLASKIRFIDLVSGKGTTLQTGETPIDGMFLNGRLYLLERDARALERIGTDGARASIPLAADPAFVRSDGDRIYVYSRTAGVLQEISTAPFAVQRTVDVAPFGSDLELDSKNAYIIYPQSATVGVVSLTPMKPLETLKVGFVPIDASVASNENPLQPARFAIADPSAKRVWMTNGSETFLQAMARGFLRGLIGIGLYDNRSSQFPTGVDRVAIRGRRSYAYDSSSRTLYRFDKTKSSIVAKDVDSGEFTVGSDALYVWDDAVRRLQRFDGND